MSLAALLFIVMCSTSSILVAEAKRTYKDKIEHVIVLMMENRAFDHLLGHKVGVDGLTGNESNPVSTLNPHQRIPTTMNASFVAACDPNHGVPATTMKIFGALSVLENRTNSTPCMCGFAETEDFLGNADLDYCGVMETFNTAKDLPVMNALVDEFVLFDRWFCSVPGPTWPNRMFFFSGTSAGSTATGPWYHNRQGDLFPQRTIFDQVEDAGGQWRVYYNDTPWELFLNTLAHNPQHLKPLDQFFEDAASGKLPHFAFINPRSGVNISEGVGSNDQHPDHDVSVGESLYKSVYEALRASPAWNKTLFVLTYDEHGGFYDHVPTPLNVPPPGDGETSYPDEFAFDRLGLRIPTLLISPWLRRGKVVTHPPKSHKPAPNSEFEATSVIATTRKLLSVLHGTGPLTARDAWSATFEYLFEELDEPRTDCPMHLPKPHPPKHINDTREGELPVNPLQRDILDVHAVLLGIEHPTHIRQQKHVSEWAIAHFRKHETLTAAWKESKHKHKHKETNAPQATFLSVQVRSLAKALNDSVAHKWHYSFNSTRGVGTFSVNIGDGLGDIYTHYCLDAGNMEEWAVVELSMCYPSANATHNRDTAQHFLLMNDATIRPAHAKHLCLTTRRYEGSNRLRLRTCNGDVSQHFAWHGPAAGDHFQGWIYFSDTTNVIGVWWA
jgi:phospholipase C